MRSPRSHLASTVAREGLHMLISGRWLTAAVFAVVVCSTAALIGLETVEATRTARAEIDAMSRGRDVVRFRLDEGGVSVPRCLSLARWSDVEAAATTGSSRNVAGLNVVRYSGSLGDVLGLQATSSRGALPTAILGADLRESVGFARHGIAVGDVWYNAEWGPASERARSLRSVVAVPEEVGATAQECWCLLRPGSPPGTESAIAAHLAEGSNLAIAERQFDTAGRVEAAEQFLESSIHGVWRMLGGLVGVFVLIYLYVRKPEIALYADLGFSYEARLGIVGTCGLLVLIVGIPVGTLVGAAVGLSILGSGPAVLDSALNALLPFASALVLCTSLSSAFIARASDLESRR